MISKIPEEEALSPLTAPQNTQINGNLTLAGDKNLTLTSGTGSLVLNSSLTNASDQVVDVSPAFAGGATDLLTYTVF